MEENHRENQAGRDPRSDAQAAALEDAASDRLGSKSPVRMGWLWRCLQIIFWTLLVASVSVWLFYHSMQIEPDFYETAIQRSEVELAENGDRFETKVLELQNNARQAGNWSYVFSEEEVNGWLAIDCPKKFPELIPSFLVNPRIQILDSELQVVFHYQSRRVSAVVVLAGDVFVAEPGGEIALRIKSAKSGLVPLPIAKVADRITRHLRSIGIAVRWEELDGDPLALLKIPPDKLKLGEQSLQIQTIGCQDRQVLVAGQSRELGSD